MRIHRISNLSLVGKLNANLRSLLLHVRNHLVHPFLPELLVVMLHLVYPWCGSLWVEEEGFPIHSHLIVCRQFLQRQFHATLADETPGSDVVRDDVDLKGFLLNRRRGSVRGCHRQASSDSSYTDKPRLCTF